MKKITKSFTFWLILMALYQILMHQIGKDSKSITLISLNPILAMIPGNSSLFNFMNSGMRIPSGTIMGSTSVYWYIASVLTFIVYGAILDLARLIILKIRRRRK